LTFNFWPYDKPVFVLSNRLTELPDACNGKAEIVNGDLNELIKRLNERGYRNLYIDGGKTVQNFLREDLVDEMIIATVPVLLGDGIPLFGKLNHSIDFCHKKTEIISNSLVMSFYVRYR